jgi:hypothetical protein
MAAGTGDPDDGLRVCHHVAMSDEDLWRQKDPADPSADEAEQTGEAAGETPRSAEPPAEPPSDLDMTQPITGGSSATPPPEAPTPPPAPPGPSYDAPPGPGAVPPPTNPYGQSQPGPSGAPYGGQQPPPPNPYGTGPQPYPPQEPYATGGQPYVGQQNPYPPPPNPYPQPQEYASPQNPYGVPYQPAYAGGRVPDQPSATTAMVLGIVGLVGILFCGGITLVLSPFAWAIGAKSVREIDQQPGRYGGRDKAQAGKWMGIIGTILLILGVVFIAFLIIGLSVSSTDSDPTFGNG